MNNKSCDLKIVSNVIIDVKRLNFLHSEVVRHFKKAAGEVFEGVMVAAEAGELLLEVKNSLTHGHWMPWLEINFHGSDRTARRYMALAKSVSNVGDLRGLSLRQAYLKLGIAFDKNHSKAEESLRSEKLPPLSRHVTLAVRFAQWTNSEGRLEKLTEQQRKYMKQDLRGMYDWLRRLFSEDEAS